MEKLKAGLFRILCATACFFIGYKGITLDRNWFLQTSRFNQFGQTAEDWQFFVFGIGLILIGFVFLFIRGKSPQSTSEPANNDVTE